MVASWDLKANPSVLCAILHVETCTIAWAFGFRNLIIPGNVIGLTGMPFDHARNQASMSCIECGADYLFFLDSDVIPPRDAILRLLAHNKPIVSGVYYRRSHPAGIPVMMKPVGQWLVRYRKNALIEVDVVGAGCLLIHRSVLEQMKPQRPEVGRHWFDWRVDCRMPEVVNKGLPPLSEDFTFCIAVKQQLGIPTLVDTSIQCRHVGHSQVTENAISPLDSTPVT